MVWLNTGMLKSRAIQMMPTSEYVRKFKACILDGEQNEFSSFVRRKRPSIRQWRSLKRTVFERDNHTCVYCGATQGPLHCDHVVPVIRGGSNDLSNLVTACAFCNGSKGKKTLEEWRPCNVTGTFLAEKIQSSGTDNEVV